ncbi:OLC1v1031077C1 [Oldenlandia corymbosa var. corymbosa]|uniref:OLC1v1031077C1 n=1 Tax=Oldenlandia corymbosa var. corymbosa TaxID=529605 RepID=A0AAV1CJE0_OLDCO|nr:OLC1v1031077C1 [Oldenlandia corymbosa var. corymbosa]
MWEYFIPDDLVALVLVRLPFDALFRCRSVSKSWRDLIDAPNFTQLYLNSSPLDNTKQHIIACPPSGRTFYAFQWVHELEGSSQYKAINPKKFENPFPDFFSGQVQIVGSSNGILCLWNKSSDSLLLWNPWINKFSSLPGLPVDCTEAGSYCVGAAFGIDPKNDDYKVVKWYEFEDVYGYEFCVYSLKLNSWRRIKDGLPYDEVIEPHSSCTFVNGVLYFVVKYDESESDDDYDNYDDPDDDDYDSNEDEVYFIVGFDLGSEEFRYVCSVPVSPRYKDQYDYHHLLSLNGRLQCFSSYMNRGGLMGQIWERRKKDDRDKMTWDLVSFVSFYSRGSDFRDSRILAVEEKYRILLQVGEKLVLHDFDKRSIGEVIINDKEAGSITSCTCVQGFVNPCSFLI